MVIETFTGVMFGNSLFTRDGDWDFHWCDVGWMKEYFDHYYLEEHMKLCHFRNHYEVYINNMLSIEH